MAAPLAPTWMSSRCRRRGHRVVDLSDVGRKDLVVASVALSRSSQATHSSSLSIA